METQTEILRQEIISSQQARMELLKYKLLSMAALGAVGLGIEGDNNILNNSVDYILCLIPLVCVYTDFLCYHNNIRIFVIAKYLIDHEDSYEKYISELCFTINPNNDIRGRNLFNMEDFVLIRTSLFASVLVIKYGIFSSMKETSSIIYTKIIVFSIFGIIGITLTIIAKSIFNNKMRLIFKTKLKNNEYL